MAEPRTEAGAAQTGEGAPERTADGMHHNGGPTKPAALEPKAAARSRNRTLWLVIGAACRLFLGAPRSRFRGREGEHRRATRHRFADREGIVGLIPSTRAFAEQMAVPLGSLIPATYLLLLTLLAWPLIKLWQMGNVERLRAFELHVMVLAGLTATGMMTFAILSSATEAAASARLDDNLVKIAQPLQWRFQDEIHCAFAELNDFRKQPQDVSVANARRKPIQYYPWFTSLTRRER
jgi:hypothetical protein